MSNYRKCTAVLKLSTCSLLVAGLAGCSTLPTPFGFKNGEFIADYTLDIIRHVRCEARDAMIYRAADLMKRLAKEDIPSSVSGKLIKISQGLFENPARLSGLDFWDIDPRVYILSSPILKSTVGFKFEFNITEKNDRSFSPSLTSSTGASVVTVGGLTTSLNRKRNNTRTLDISAKDFDSFQNLNCSGDTKNRKNIAAKKDYHYPLRGKIDLDKSINTFIDYFLIDIGKLNSRVPLAENSLLDAVKLVNPSIKTRNSAINYMAKFGSRLDTCTSEKNASCSNIVLCYAGILDKAGDYYIRDIYNAFGISRDPKSSMTDVLKFTTELNGGAEPSIAFNVAGSIKTKALGFSFKPARTDIHQVTIGMTAAIPAVKSKTVETINIGGNNGYKILVKVPGKKSTKPDEVKSCVKFRNSLTSKGSRKHRRSAKENKRDRSLNKIAKKTLFPVIKQSAAELRNKNIEIQQLYEQTERRIFVDSVRKLTE